MPGEGSAPAYELRFTRTALDDLGCPADIAPGDIDAIEATTRVKRVVAKFRELRADVPTGTQAPMRDVGRPDVYALHGPDGDRACTWFDDEAAVCWFLGWVPQHDYAEFEDRAANGDLLPNEDDYTVLEVERENLDFDQRIGPGIRRMVDEALDHPGASVRRTVGDLLALDVSVEAVPLDDTTVVDLYISVGVPPLDEPPAGWPGRELPTRLAELATGADADELQLDFPTAVPSAAGTTRPVEHGNELAVVVRTWALPDLS
jgi:hypothetical protein